MSNALEDIAAERRRQIEAEGWTPEHDDQHTKGELAAAAGCYALSDEMAYNVQETAPLYWPWEAAWWKPKSRREDLVRAGALIVAEIERIDRAAEKMREFNGGYSLEEEGRAKLTKEEFCARFKAYMLAKVGEKDANGDSVAEYADETAPTYWDDPFLGSLGPEECAQADLDEWEPA